MVIVFSDQTIKKLLNSQFDTKQWNSFTAPSVASFEAAVWKHLI